jgi:hypothetical protein
MSHELNCYFQSNEGVRVVTFVILYELCSIFMEQISNFCSWVSSSFFCCLQFSALRSEQLFFWGSCLPASTFLADSQPGIGLVFFFSHHRFSVLRVSPSIHFSLCFTSQIPVALMVRCGKPRPVFIHHVSILISLHRGKISLLSLCSALVLLSLDLLPARP